MPRIRSLILGLATTIALTATLLTPSPAQAMTGWTYSSQAVKATNNRRAEHGAHRLSAKAPCLKKYAQAQAQRMANQRRMFHQDVQKVLNHCGQARVGENVGYGYWSGYAIVNKGWMHSPSHRANLLDRRFRVVAVAARRGSNGKWYVSQLLGRRR